MCNMITLETELNSILYQTAVIERIVVGIKKRQQLISNRMNNSRYQSQITHIHNGIKNGRYLTEIEVIG